MNDNVFVISLSIVILFLIGTITFYKVKELQSLESNVKSAVEKGIDPLAVRCAYSRSEDLICIAYSAGKSVERSK